MQIEEIIQGLNGDQLDRWGDLLENPRAGGEEDNSFRLRLLTHFRPLKSADFPEESPGEPPGEIPGADKPLAVIFQEIADALKRNNELMAEIRAAMPTPKPKKEKAPPIPKPEKPSKEAALDAAIIDFYKNHVTPSDHPLAWTKLIDIYGLFKYITQGRYSRKFFLERFHIQYPQHGEDIRDGVRVLTGLRLHDTLGVC